MGSVRGHEGKETRNRRSRACAVLESAHSNALAAGNKDVLTPVFSARRAARARVPAAHQRVRRARLRGALLAQRRAQLRLVQLGAREVLPERVVLLVQGLVLSLGGTMIRKCF